MNDANPRNPLLAAIVLFAAVGVLIAADLMMDYRAGGSTWHLLAELAVLAAAVGGVTLLWRQLRQSREDLAGAREAAARWQQEHAELLRGLSAAIDVQFHRWGLTEAEAEVGLLLLKGLSLKEIGQARQTSERTVREQARALYRKAGLSGRASLSAFFLEDLLLPGAASAPVQR